MSLNFEIYKDLLGQFRFRLKASNGETLLASEGHPHKRSAEAAIASAKKNATGDAFYERTASSGKGCCFVLRGTNYEVIGTSEMYGSALARDEGIEAVKAAVSTATVVNDTADERTPALEPSGSSDPPGSAGVCACLPHDD